MTGSRLGMYTAFALAGACYAIVRFDAWKRQRAVRGLAITADRRTKQQLALGSAISQAFDDSRLEAYWRRRIRDNVRRRAELKRRVVPNYLRHQAY